MRLHNLVRFHLCFGISILLLSCGGAPDEQVAARHAAVKKSQDAAVAGQDAAAVQDAKAKKDGPQGQDMCIKLARQTCRDAAIDQHKKHKFKWQ